MAGYLRRYTDVLSLLDILHHNRITLLPPSRWYDQNDALGLKQYSDKRGDGSVFALCLAEGYEQAHHWQIFAGHAHGLCIQFDKDEFIEHLDRYARGGDVIHGPVIYANLTQIAEMNPIPVETLPFLKRDTFKAEAEYRVIGWEHEFFANETYAIPMPSRLIKKVTLGPAMPDELALTLKAIVTDLMSGSTISFAKSRLVNNASWAKAIADGLKGR